MSSRKYDVIVYGATGFTGKLVAKYIHEHCSFTRWAIGGRSQEKLEQLKNELIKSVVGRSTAIPDIVIADTAQSSSLGVFGESILLLNCTGPYRFLGRPIVQACIDNGTHYMDITGEPQFMEASFLDLHERAVQNKCIVIHSCAFDSVPADLGNIFVSRTFRENCCNVVESFLELKGEEIRGHFTTFECAVHGVGDAESLREVRKKIDAKFSPPKSVFPGKKLNRQTGFFFDKRIGKYCMPFMGADASVVRSSQRFLSLSKGAVVWPQYGAYVSVGNWTTSLFVGLYGLVFSLLASFSAGRDILLKYPGLFSGGIFSHEGPSQRHLDNTSFAMRFYARGFSDESAAARGKEDKQVEAVVEGPEPGYVATPIIFVALAECLLAERSSMPDGVLTPAAAFFGSKTVFDRLVRAGVNFRVVAETSIDS